LRWQQVVQPVGSAGTVAVFRSSFWIRHDQVGDAVAVEVAGGHAPDQVVVGEGTPDHHIGGVNGQVQLGGPHGLAAQDEHRTGAEAIFPAGLGGVDQQFRIAVTVQVLSVHPLSDAPSRGPPQGDIRLRRQVDGRRCARWPFDHVDDAGLGTSCGRRAGTAEHEVVGSIAVHVPDGHSGPDAIAGGTPELQVRGLAPEIDAPVQGIAAVEDVHGARITAFGGVEPFGTDDEVVDAIPVDVAGGDGGPEGVALRDPEDGDIGLGGQIDHTGEVAASEEDVNGAGVVRTFQGAIGERGGHHQVLDAIGVQVAQGQVGPGVLTADSTPDLGVCSPLGEIDHRFRPRAAEKDADGAGTTAFVAGGLAVEVAGHQIVDAVAVDVSDNQVKSEAGLFDPAPDAHVRMGDGQVDARRKSVAGEEEIDLTSDVEGGVCIRRTEDQIDSAVGVQIPHGHGRAQVVAVHSPDDEQIDGIAQIDGAVCSGVRRFAGMPSEAQRYQQEDPCEMGKGERTFSPPPRCCWLQRTHGLNNDFTEKSPG